jgi:tetratricopeptide (TPR) repeat protein
MTLTKHDTHARASRTVPSSGRRLSIFLVFLLAVACAGGPPPAETAAAPPVKSVVAPPEARVAPPAAPVRAEDREGSAYARIAEAPNLEACDRYLEEFPQGLHADEVRRLRHDLEWQAVVAAGEVDPLREWLRTHPDSPHAPEAGALWEKRRYTQALSESSGEACNLYLTELPQGRRIQEVRSRCEELAWSRIEARRDRGELERWLAAHEEAPQRDRAERLLEEIRFEEVRRQPGAELCRRYLEQYPRGRFVHEVRELLSLALAWEAAEQEHAVESYLAFAAEHPGHPRRSQALERSSVEYWRRQVRESPGRGHSWTQLAEACLHARACTLKEIETDYRRALERDPESALALLGLARLYYNQDEYDTARELLERSVALDDRIAATHLYLGRLQAREEHWRQAIEHLDRALELSPDSEEALYYRATSKLRIGGCRPALPDLRRLTATATEHRSKFVLQAERHVEVCTGGGR